MAGSRNFAGAECHPCTIVPLPRRPLASRFMPGAEVGGPKFAVRLPRPRPLWAFPVGKRPPLMLARSRGLSNGNSGGAHGQRPCRAASSLFPCAPSLPRPVLARQPLFFLRPAGAAAQIPAIRPSALFASRARRQRFQCPPGVPQPSALPRPFADSPRTLPDDPRPSRPSPHRGGGDVRSRRPIARRQCGHLGHQRYKKNKLRSSLRPQPRSTGVTFWAHWRPPCAAPWRRRARSGQRRRAGAPPVRRRGRGGPPARKVTNEPPPILGRRARSSTRTFVAAGFPCRVLNFRIGAATGARP